jgi:chromosome segregation ATPase
MCKAELEKVSKQRAVALICGTENKALKKQLSDAEGKVQDLTSELSQQKKELSRRERELSQREKVKVGSTQALESPQTGSMSQGMSNIVYIFPLMV